MVGWMVGYLVGWLVAWLVGRMVGWLVGWSDGWLVGRMVGWPLIEHDHPQVTFMWATTGPALQKQSNVGPRHQSNITKKSASD